MNGEPRGIGAREREQLQALALANAVRLVIADVRVEVKSGWLSIAAVVTALALGLQTRHPAALVALTAAAGAANAAAMFVPWRQWLTGGRGRLLLDLWSGGLITERGPDVRVGERFLVEVG